MVIAKIFRHGGSQAVRLPKLFRFEGTEVEVERRGDEVVLRPHTRPRPRTLKDLASHMKAAHPCGAEFPNIPRAGTRQQQSRDLNLDAKG